MNCYVDISAATDCDAISISYTSVAVEKCPVNYYDLREPECWCDRFWISNENRNFPKQCGCKGDGCDDVIWGRNIAHPITGEEDYYTYYDDDNYLNKDGSYNLDKIYDAVGTLGESGYTTPLNDGQIVLGNKFRFNFQSDQSLSHGGVRLYWQCIDPIATTSYPSTFATTTFTTGTTTSRTAYYYHPAGDSTTTDTTTSTTTATTSRTAYYYHPAGESTTSDSTTTATTTTTEETTTSYSFPFYHPAPADSTTTDTSTSTTTATTSRTAYYYHPAGESTTIDTITTTAIITTTEETTTSYSFPFYHPAPAHSTTTDTTTSTTTIYDNQCYHNDFELLRAVAKSGIDGAVANDNQTYSHSTHAGFRRQAQFSRWLKGIFDIFYYDVTDQLNPRKCLMGRAPENFTKDVLGRDCAFDIANDNIKNACLQLKSFFEWVYDDCRTEGVKLLARLEFRCNRISQIRKKIANRP